MPKSFQYKVIPYNSQDNKGNYVLRCDYENIDCDDELILKSFDTFMSRDLQVQFIQNPKLYDVLTNIASTEQRTPIVLVYTWKYHISETIEDSDGNEVGTLSVTVSIEDSSDFKKYLNLVHQFKEQLTLKEEQPNVKNKVKRDHKAAGATESSVRSSTTSGKKKDSTDQAGRRDE